MHGAILRQHTPIVDSVMVMVMVMMIVMMVVMMIVVIMTARACARAVVRLGTRPCVPGERQANRRQKDKGQVCVSGSCEGGKSYNEPRLPPSVFPPRSVGAKSTWVQ